jgi:hypothetical protein
VDGVRGQVPIRWRITPAFGYGARAPRLETRGGTPVATDGPDALAICSWDAGEAHIDQKAIFGRFEAREGSSALIALCAARQEPLVFPRREDVEARLEATTAYWRRWAGQRAYSGPWRDSVIRSALALKLLLLLGEREINHLRASVLALSAPGPPRRRWAVERVPAPRARFSMPVGARVAGALTDSGACRLPVPSLCGGRCPGCARRAGRGPPRAGGLRGLFGASAPEGLMSTRRRATRRP